MMPERNHSSCRSNGLAYGQTKEPAFSGGDWVPRMPLAQWGDGPRNWGVF